MVLLFSTRPVLLVWHLFIVVAIASSNQLPLNDLVDSYHGAAVSPGNISLPLFSSLERSARLVDIAYCVGTTGITAPFSCASRCKGFSSVYLVSTWNTGVLLSDSCGYIAVDLGMQTEAKDIPHGPAILVAFRGTYSIANTVMDLSTIPQEYVPYQPRDNQTDHGDKPRDSCSNCTVHMGFMASWNQARRIVLPRLLTVRDKYPSFPVHLMGHSLGGAVAALAALELRMSLGWKNVVVTTFGEPMVGNAEFVAYLNKAFMLEGTDDYVRDLKGPTYRRVTHIGDPVPLLPLAEWGFRPHAGEIHIRKADLPPSPEDLRLCRGNSDPKCIADGGGETSSAYSALSETSLEMGSTSGDFTAEEKQFRLPAKLKLWQLFFAHRDYFWRLGLCVPGGDPWDWGREYSETMSV
ncbi:hypothetical protein VTK73DRAFT_8895 [Phialemonium thermophilum]|uniref:Fungal lipase-type domain-containing protein n=1 Tax=Phialemonium thermophilum TaxID=223376 RepID=A0ABR3XND7_9PEZI